ncbi:MAG: hypothetical protein M3Y87_17120 [Myxococcota bacterium]|nr:hypothetical protein [Myxococcota bacterium]
MRALSLSLLVVLAGASTALAQDTARPRTSEATTYDFEDDLVEGGRYDAEGVRVDTRLRAARRTLIRPRTQFIPELLASTENL